jgi:hypothetical protein
MSTCVEIGSGACYVNAFYFSQLYEKARKFEELKKENILLKKEIIDLKNQLKSDTIGNCVAIPETNMEYPNPKKIISTDMVTEMELSLLIGNKKSWSDMCDEEETPSYEKIGEPSETESEHTTYSDTEEDSEEDVNFDEKYELESQESQKVGDFEEFTEIEEVPTQNEFSKFPEVEKHCQIISNIKCIDAKDLAKLKRETFVPTTCRHFIESVKDKTKKCPYGNKCIYGHMLCYNSFKQTITPINGKEVIGKILVSADKKILVIC